MSDNAPIAGGAPKLCCALPYRISGDHVEVLLVAERSGAWHLPQGEMTDAEAPFQTAEREAWEEAGVRGAIDVLPIGGFDRPGGGAEPVHILVYPLGVSEEATHWPEADRRRRKWASAKEAARLIAPELSTLISDSATDTDAMFGDGDDKGFERN